MKLSSLPASIRRQALPQLAGPVEREAELHAQIKAECEARSWLCFRGAMHHRTSRTIGEPDFIIPTRDGRVLFIEAKRPKGKATREQAAVGIYLSVFGHHYALVHDIAEFRAVADGQHKHEQHHPDAD